MQVIPEIKKTLLSLPWDKSESFCDTTQIDISSRKMSTRYTYHHTCPDG